MCVGQVTDVDVIPDAASIFRIVIGSIDFKVFTPTEQGFEHQRQKIIGFLLQPPHFSIGVIACSIEIAQACITHVP